MSNELNKILSYVKPLPKDEDWFKDRIKKCLECPLNTKNGAELDSAKKKVATVLVNEEYGQCSLCGCPVERKASLKDEECPDNPRKWGSLVTKPPKGVTSITDMFSVECEGAIESIKTVGGTFVVNALDVKKDLFLTFKVATNFKGKALKFMAGCLACTKGSVEKKEDHYIIKVKVTKEDKGRHTVAFNITFDRDGIVGRASVISLQFKVNFNKI